MTTFGEYNRKYVQQQTLVTNGVFTSKVMLKSPRQKSQHQDKTTPWKWTQRNQFNPTPVENVGRKTRLSVK